MFLHNFGVFVRKTERFIYENQSKKYCSKTAGSLNKLYIKTVMFLHIFALFFRPNKTIYVLESV